MPKAIKTGTKRKGQPKSVIAEPTGPVQEIREKSKAISIHIPKDLLVEIDNRLSGGENRESFILAAIRAHLLAATQPRKITKAISQSKSTLKTGRYEE
jgi:hypothetical protein